MSRIILITGMFDEYDHWGTKTGKKTFGVSHGINEDTLESVCLPGEHPKDLGAVFNSTLGEWVIE